MPGGVQGLDRYAYVNNSPINYIDPTGHFTEDAIWKYLLKQYNNDAKLASEIFSKWQKDDEWWNMLLNAHPGNVLFGEISWGQHDGDPFGISFEGGVDNNGQEYLTGVTRLDSNRPTTLVDIQNGVRSRGMVKEGFNWVGIYNMTGENVTFTFLRSETIAKTNHNFVDGKYGEGLKWLSDLALATIPSFGPYVAAGSGFLDIYDQGFGALLVDGLDMERGDIWVMAYGPVSVRFVIQPSNNGYGQPQIESPSGGIP